jgi:hypothetical protein
MSDDEKPRVTRRFPVCPVGVPNHNGRIYPRELWERMIAEHQPEIDARRMLVGFLETDGKLRYDPDHIGAIVTKMGIEDDQVMIDVEILDTNLGRILTLPTDLIEVYPTGSGTVDKDGVVNGDDYKLAGFSVSSRPKEPTK